jgi:hypothetical protein
MGETTVGGIFVKVVPYAIEWDTADGLRQAEPLKNSHTRGHQSFTALFFSREMSSLKKLNRKAAAAEQHC